MKELIFIAQSHASDPVNGKYPVSRIMLRQVLLSGLDDVIHFDKQFVRYERGADGTITAFFADGTTAIGDVLIGADGIGSKVRQQYLLHATIVDTGAVAVSGKFWLTEQTRNHLPPQLTTRLNNILPPSGCGMFIAQFINQGAGATSELPDADLADHVFWAFIARRDTYGTEADLHGMDGLGLRQLVLRMVADWHPTPKRMVAESDPATMFTTPIQTSVPMSPWETSNVTLLGDAIHAMTPLQGLGGNTALRDASLLCRHLVAANSGDAALLTAIHDYETAMREYGAAAVRASLQATEYAISDSRMARSIFKTVLRVADAVPPLKHRMFPVTGG